MPVLIAEIERLHAETTRSRILRALRELGICDDALRGGWEVRELATALAELLGQEDIEAAGQLRRDRLAAALEAEILGPRKPLPGQVEPPAEVKP